MNIITALKNAYRAFVGRLEVSHVVADLTRIVDRLEGVSRAKEAAASRHHDIADAAREVASMASLEAAKAAAVKAKIAALIEG